MSKTFDSYLRNEKRFTESTAESYVIQTTEFLKWRKHKRRLVTYKEVIEYLDVLNKRKYTYATIQGRLTAMKHYFEFKNYKVNPVQNIKLRGREKKVLVGLLSEEKIENIYRNYKEKESIDKEVHLRNTVIVGLICFQGIKSNEINKIKVNAVSLDQFTIRIPASRKANERLLQIKSQQLIDLHQYINEVRKNLLNRINLRESEYLIVGNKRENDLTTIINNIPIDLQQISKDFKNLNQIRNSVIVNWLKTENLRKVQYKAGHKYVGSTEHFKTSDLEELRGKLVMLFPL